MKNMKKIILSIIVAVLMANISMVGAHANVLDNLENLVYMGDSEGPSFKDYKPGEDLTLSDKGLNKSLTAESDAKSFVIKIVNFALGFLGLFAVLIVIYGGILYVTSAGEEEKATKGKDAIKYAVIGLLIVMGSYAFVNTIINSAGGTDSGSDGFTGGGNTGVSFNASSEQVRTVAKDLYTDYLFFAEVNQELKGILNDLEKESLKYNSKLVSRNSMLTFLYSVKSKLINIRSKTVKFSTPYVRISDLLNTIEVDVDKVRSAGHELYIRIVDEAGGVDLCKGDEEDGSGKISVDKYKRNENGEVIYSSSIKKFFSDVWGLISGSYNSAKCKSQNFTLYPTDLLLIWSGEDGIRQSLLSNDPANKKSLAYISDAVRADFLKKAKEHIDDISRVNQEISGIKVGEVKSLYTNMIKSYGYDPDHPGTYYPDSFLDSINKWVLDNDPAQIDVAGEYLVKAIGYQMDFYKAVANLKSVNAVLKASVVEGNAPLVVTFDVLGSSDPAGGSIVDSNIDWSNLGGTFTLDGKPVDIGNAVKCSTSINKQISEKDKEVYGPSVRQCTFLYPGTYEAVVTIKSNNPDKFVPGQSKRTIRVHQPETLINMDMELKDGTSIPIIKYYDNGILKSNEDYLPISLTEAKQGVSIKAYTSPSNVQNFKWSCGNDQRKDTDTSGLMTCTYDTAGKYQVGLEVLNSLNQINKKVFTLDVRDIAARISVKPSDDIFIDDPILFDGSRSSSTSGNIKAYQWSIMKNSSREEIDIEENANKERFTYKFKDPGLYTISLRVTGKNNKSFSTTKEIEIKSQPPVAKFTYSELGGNQPATIKFDPSESYDPDGEKENLEYVWYITPASENGENWIWIDGGENTGAIREKDPSIKFRKKGRYDIVLRVVNPDGIDEYNEKTASIEIDKLLDIEWGKLQENTAILSDDGTANVEFTFKSDNASAYEINFGDGDTETGNIISVETISHKYKKAGKFNVKLTVFDDEDNDNSIKKRIFIGGGDRPVANMEISVDGVNITSDEITVTKRSAITFDGSNSKNSDGTGRKLAYSWNFGDGKQSSNRLAVHSYKELSPKETGYFTVKLKVYDKEDTSMSDEDEIKVHVVSMPPTFTSLQAIESSGEDVPTTPVTLMAQVFGAEDVDGTITRYKWWYYDVADPEEQLGVKITQSPSVKMIIGTNGREGEQRTYKVAVEVTDSDNLTTKSEDVIPQDQLPVVTVKNGPNDLPVAKFNVSATTVFTGDSVKFSSASSDSDGKIVTYIWDLEGDGFYNDNPTDSATIEHVYDKKNTGGYMVRLKVVDDKGGESVSQPVKIFVDSVAKPPVAAFTANAIKGSDGMKIRFINNSQADKSANTEIISSIWDFDIESTLATADSNGDGKSDNDIDSTSFSPDRLYTVPGVYKVKLIVTDNQGNTDEVINAISVGVNPGMNSNTPQQEALGMDQPTQNAFQEQLYGDGGQTAPIQPTITESTTQEPEEQQPEEQQPEEQQPAIQAVLKTFPKTADDGIIYIEGDSGHVSFDFSGSVGTISTYTLDKNILYDTDKNGIKDDDKNFQTQLSGIWTTNFESSWGKIVVKLTVTDLHGNTNSVTREIKFIKK